MLLAAGIALVPMFSLTLYWALSYTTVANTALVRMTEPAWVLLLGALLLASARRDGSSAGSPSPFSAPWPSCSSGNRRAAGASTTSSA